MTQNKAMVMTENKKEVSKVILESVPLGYTLKYGSGNNTEQQGYLGDRIINQAW